PAPPHPPPPLTRAPPPPPPLSPHFATRSPFTALCNTAWFHRTSCRSRARRTAAGAAAPGQHTLALDDVEGASSRCAASTGPTYRLPEPRNHRCDVHAHLVDETGAKTWPPTSPTATSTTRCPASSCARATASLASAVAETAVK